MSQPIPNAAVWQEHYEPGVPKTVDIPHQNLVELMRGPSQRYGDKTVLRMVLKYLPLGLKIQSKLSYRELDEATNRFANALISLGVQKGDRVSLMLPNLPQQVIAYFGTLKAGAVVVNTNPTYTPRELQHQLEDSGAETIVLLSGLVENLEKIRANTGLRNVIVTNVEDSLSFPFKQLVARQTKESGMSANVSGISGVQNFYELLQAQSASTPSVSVSYDDNALFQYTGGTTGRAKAAVLTHGNLVANTMQMDAWFSGLEHGKEVLLGALPNFHVYGMTVGMLLALYTGAELVIVPNPRDIDLIMEIIHRERVSVYPGIPTMYVGLTNHEKISEYDLTSIKACLSGGMALPVEVAQRFEKITGGRLVEGYGLTETSPVASANPIFGEKRYGSIGVPLPETELSVFSLEPGEDGRYERLGVGEEGEICIKGPQVMSGYWNVPDETAIAIDNEGWFHSGDIGKMDEDGYFYIVDRKKDLIIASGYNIVPREVEEVLFMHDKVMEAAVAGVQDPRRGETVKAFVVLKPGQQATQDEIIAFCKENLAPYKVPKMMEFRDELPKSQVGKVLRRVLVEEEKAKQGQGEEVDKARV